jgi:hypothetical protein
MNRAFPASAVIACAVAALASAAGDVVAGAAVLDTYQGMPVVVSEGGDAARDLQSVVDCSPTEIRKASVTLQWKVAHSAGSEQRVLVSIYGFREGKFEASEPLAPAQSRLGWTRVHGQALHSWMVLTRQGSGWRASPVETFTGPGCVADMQPAPRR